MLYQKIFSGASPYRISISTLSYFPEHRHADYELNYCVKGSFDIVIDKKTFHVTEGCTSLIPPMTSHAIPRQPRGSSCKVITLIAGMSLMKEHFNTLSALTPLPMILDLTLPECSKIHSLFQSSHELLASGDSTDELLITSNVYAIFHSLTRHLSLLHGKSEVEKDMSRVENVEKALELIYNHYREDITVEDAARLTGWGKSNFCKIFKSVAGETFHKMLNQFRAENARELLLMTNMSVTDIAIETGFPEAKTFCRVFREFYGTTPAKYRREEKGLKG